MTDDIIDTRYHFSNWNTYIFQCSDGDNWPGDNEHVAGLISTILPKIQFFGYCEICPNEERIKWISETSLSKLYETMTGDKFKSVGIYSKNDIWAAFNNFFKGEY
jgi:uncharacterized sporulation protein YeaH/YhbH (DUF444 family)